MKQLLMVGLVMAGLLTGCGSKEEVKQEPKKEVVKEEVKQEPTIKKEQYDVVWGTYDKEWVYSDSWTGEGFESFDVALEVLDKCSKDTEEATEQCVKDYLIKH